MGQHQLGQYQLGQHQLGQYQLGQYQLGQYQLGQYLVGQYQLGYVDATGADRRLVARGHHRLRSNLAPDQERLRTTDRSGEALLPAMPTGVPTGVPTGQRILASHDLRP